MAANRSAARAAALKAESKGAKQTLPFPGAGFAAALAAPSNANEEQVQRGLTQPQGAGPDVTAPTFGSDVGSHSFRMTAPYSVNPLHTITNQSFNNGNWQVDLGSTQLNFPDEQSARNAQAHFHALWDEAGGKGKEPELLGGGRGQSVRGMIGSGQGYFGGTNVPPKSLLS